MALLGPIPGSGEKVYSENGVRSGTLSLTKTSLTLYFSNSLTSSGSASSDKVILSTT